MANPVEGESRSREEPWSRFMPDLASFGLIYTRFSTRFRDHDVNPEGDSPSFPLSLSPLFESRHYFCLIEVFSSNVATGFYVRACLIVNYFFEVCVGKERFMGSA